MVEHFQHLILYDGECGLCDRSVQFILKIDKDKAFAFAPLNGNASNEILALFPTVKQVDSAVLVENFREPQKKAYTETSAVFRILWLVGGPWKLIGWLFFFPSFLFNWAYHLVSHYRYRLVARSCFVPNKDKKDRFLM